MSRRLSVRAHALTFSYDAAPAPILADVSFHLAPGWTGLVGPNGAGKTTLLRLILGELSPSSGHLALEPREARVALCSQGVEARGEVEAFAAAGDREAHRLRALLSLEDEVLERWSSGASPGERRRWQIAAALWSAPDVLLLDEPGNHLDDEGRAVLVAALRQFRGIGVLVSHDRRLLNESTSSTLRLQGGAAQQVDAPWSRAKDQWTLEAAQARERQSSLRDRLERDLSRLTDRRDTLRGSTTQRSAGARMKDRRDGDARSVSADFRAEQAEKAHAAQLRRMGRRVGELKTALAGVRVEDEAGQALFLRDEPCPRPVVVQHAELQLQRGEHVWLRGRNGAGKSTLLARVLHASTLPPDRVLLLPQELTEDDTRADLAHVDALPRELKGRVLQLVHALGVEPAALLGSACPSPGEARKLRLALGLGRHVWLAVLDEPTNHLDLPAIERLEDALRGFPGALLLVTHDEDLGQRVTTRQVELPRP